MRIIVLILSMLVFLGCNKSGNTHCEPANTANRIEFGTFFGECAGNCVNIYSVNQRLLRKDDSAPYPNVVPGYVFVPTRTMPAEKFVIARSLLNAIPTELLFAPGTTFGNPDSHDQGGMYIAIHRQNTIERFLIDHDNTADQSAAVIAYKQKVWDVLSQLR